MRIITVIALLFCLIAFSQVAEANSVVIQWNQLLLNTVKAAKTAPPYFSRMLYIVHQAMFDAWAMYDANAISSKIGPAIRRPLAERTLDNKNKAVSYAAFVAFNDVYPAYKANSTALMVSLGYDANDTTKDLTTPSGIGNFAAFCLLQFRHGDGSNQLGDMNNSTAYSDYTGYTPTNTPDSVIDPNLWQPLRVNNNTQKYVGPHWGNVQTFANDIWPPITAPAYLTPSQNYTDQCQELINYSANLTDNQKMIAEYWAGGPGSVTPPGLWNQIAQFVSNRDSYDLDKDVKLFFLLNAGLFDASVVCWGVKRYYNSVRPITAIRYLFNGKTIKSWGGPNQGTKDIQGETWQPYQELTFVTPAFPSFTSGHSTFSASAAEVLRRFTGSDNLGFSTIIAKGSSTIEPGTTPAADINLTYPTFTSAATDAGISRLYGGIHFALDNVNGQNQGIVVGANVYTRGSNLIAGTVYSTPTTTPTPKPSSASTFSNSLIFILSFIAVYMF